MELTNQYSDNEIFNLKVQHLREDVALLRRQLNQERTTAIENQKLIRMRYMQSTSSRQLLEQRVSTTESNHNNQCNSSNLLLKGTPRSVGLAETSDPTVTNMPSRPRPRVWNNASRRIESRPMAKLKAPGPFEAQVLSEIKRAKPLGYPRPRPTPSNMYCEVSRIRKQRVKFFREQLDKIDNSCMQELKRIEVSKCRLTPLLEESSAWHSPRPIFANSSEICIPGSSQNLSESHCTDRNRPKAGGRSVAINTFDPKVNGHQANDFVNRSNMTRWYKTDVYNKTSRARISSNFGDRPTQYYDRHVLTRSSRINTISYSLNSDNYRFEASNGPNQKYNNIAIPDICSPYIGGEDFADSTFVTDATETNVIGYPSNAQNYEFNGQNDYEKHVSPKIGQLVNGPTGLHDRNFVVTNSSSRPRPPTRPRHGSVFRLNSTKQINHEYQCSDRKFAATNSDSNSTAYQPNSMCRLNRPTSASFNQEQFTQTHQCPDCSVHDFINNSPLTTTISHPSILRKLSTSKMFNHEEWMQAEDKCSDRKYLLNNLSCNSSGYHPKTSSSEFSQIPFNREYSQNALCNNGVARRCVNELPVKLIHTEEKCSDRKYLVNNLSCNSLGYQPKTSSCRFNETTCNQEHCEHAPLKLLPNNSDSNSSTKKSSVNSFGPVFNPLLNDSEYTHSKKFNFKQADYNSCLGPSLKHSHPQFNPGWLGPSKNETPNKLENGLSQSEHEDDWLDSKSWTVDEILKLDEEVTKSLWDTYNNQVRDLTADILKPFLSESASAYLKQFPPEQVAE